MRNKESLAAIRATGDVLTLATMRFADEVVPPEQLDGLLGEEEDVEPNKKEVDMAKALIDSLASDFEPSGYKDEYREELLDLIERKARGEDLVSVDTEAPQADQGAGPDGRARGEPGGGQGRGARRR